MTHSLQELRPYLEIALIATTALYALSTCWFRRGLHRLSLTSDGQAAVEAKHFVSIVIAARNEAEHIVACLDSVCAQTYPPDAYQVIVVDDGSSDCTGALVLEYAQARRAAGTREPEVRLLSSGQGQGSKKSALGVGVVSADGDFILTTDADCIVGEGWVEGMARLFQDDVGMVLGFSQIGERDRIRGWRWALEAVDFFGLMVAAAGSASQGHALAASGQNLAFRRRAFDEVGGYSTIAHRVSGDDVLLLQLIRR